MGLWDSLGSLAKGAMNSVNEYNAEIDSLKSSFRQEDDDYLKRKVRNGSTKEKIAAGFILKERGYDVSNLR